MNRIENIIETCKKHKFKLTPQRILIFKILEKEGHTSAENIYEEITKEFPGVSFNTVYSTLRMLEEIGEIKEMYISKERTFYDVNNKKHHHIICNKCNKIQDIYTDFKLEIPESVTKEFKITSEQIQFYGICQNCV